MACWQVLHFGLLAKLHQGINCNSKIVAGRKVKTEESRKDEYLDLDTCNGFYCDGFFQKKSYKPKMWTEVWTSWYRECGGPVPYRPAEDLAFAVLRATVFKLLKK
ncbi:hypothetical protein AgCh_005688 [Apium graveolens]